MWDTWEWKREFMHQVRLWFSWGSWAITHRLLPVAKAPVQGRRKNTSFQVSWWARASKWPQTWRTFSAGRLHPADFGSACPLPPSPFPTSPEHVGHHLQEMMQMLQMTDCPYPSFPFTVLPGHLLSPLILLRALYLLCPWSLHKCLLISRSNLWMRDVWIFNKQRRAN